MLYEVITIPTLVVIKGGKVVKTEVGAKSKDALIKMLDIWMMHKSFVFVKRTPP